MESLQCNVVQLRGNEMRNSSKESLVGGAILAFYGVVIVGFGYGWIANVVKLFNADFGHVTGELVLRGIGVIAAPLGAIMGYL